MTLTTATAIDQLAAVLDTYATELTDEQTDAIQAVLDADTDARASAVRQARALVDSGDDLDVALAGVEGSVDLTDDVLRALRAEAFQSGDQAQVDLCDAALVGDDVAAGACAHAIADARAQR